MTQASQLELSGYYETLGEMEFDIDTTGDTIIGVCKSTIDGTSADTRPRESNGTPGDIAEFYPAKEALPGDLVSLDPASGKFVKSQSAYDSRILGIVSTYPVGEHGKPLAQDTVPEDEQPTAISLAGKVPLQVSLINGAIEPGDALSASGIPGVAMKATQAGRIIGYALESFDGSTAVSAGVRQQEELRRASMVTFNGNPEDPARPGEGKILVFNNPSWHDAAAEADASAMDETASSSSEGHKAQVLSLLQALDGENRVLEQRLTELEAR
jgi:hypothetical protein